MALCASAPRCFVCRDLGLRRRQPVASAARDALHGELPRSRHPHGRGAGSAGHRADDHHRSARARPSDGALERADDGRRFLSNVPGFARGPRVRRARVRQRHSDRAGCERAVRRGRRLRDAGDHPRQHRRGTARADLAAVVAAVRASRRAPDLERADHRRSAAEHASHDGARSAHGSGRHSGHRGHPARKCVRRRGRADARPAQHGGASCRRRAADPGHSRHAHEQRAAVGLRRRQAADARA